jgi:hypothetical protein
LIGASLVLHRIQLRDQRFGQQYVPVVSQSLMCEYHLMVIAYAETRSRFFSGTIRRNTIIQRVRGWRKNKSGGLTGTAVSKSCHRSMHDQELVSMA